MTSQSLSKCTFKSFPVSRKYAIDGRPSVLMLDERSCKEVESMLDPLDRIDEFFSNAHSS